MDPADLLSHGDDRETTDRFRAVGAVLVALFAALLAVGSVGGGNASDDVLQEAIAAADAYAFFQAKNIRQSQYEIDAADLEWRLANEPDLTPEARSGLEIRLAEDRATIDRYEDEPDPAAPDDPLRGEGKVQLLAQAREHERLRDAAQERSTTFDFATAALQIAIVVLSIGLLITNRTLAALAVAIGAIGALLVVDGYLGIVALPI